MNPLTWGPDTQALINWFLAQPEDALPKAPFEIFPGSTVINHATFYEALRSDIRYGPTSSRNITGSLRSQLEALKWIVEGRPRGGRNEKGAGL